MTTIYTDSPYSCTIYVSGQKNVLSADRLATFASFTNGGTIPFYIRWQYSAKYVIDGGSTPSHPAYNGFGPLDETVDKIMGTPGLRLILNLAYLPTSWCALDATGKNVGYGNGVLPDGPAMAIYAGKIAQRYNTGAYAGLVDSGRFIIQIGNEEYDTGLNGATGGSILAPTFNYAVPAIQTYAPNAIIVAGAVRNLSSGGVHIHDWMTNLFTYVPKAGEPAQSLPYAVDIHCYFNGSNITSNGNTAPDPTTTDNSATPASAKRPSVQGNIAIIQGVLNTYSPGTQIWMLENGENLPNNSPNNKNSNPSVLPSQQSRYQRSVMAQMQFAGAGKYAFYSLQGNDDPKELCGVAISDLITHINANPQWAGVAAPTDKIYQSVESLSFQGTVGTAPIDQYFSIMNPTNGPVSWSIVSSQPWLTAVTLPTNGMKGTGGGLTSGTGLAAGRDLSIRCTADSTRAGLTTLTPLSATLTVTIGGNVSTIAVSLFVTPNAASPNLSSGSAGPGNGPTFTMTANASPPANQTITFKNQDAYATWWYAFTTCPWFTINTASGNLAAGSTQNITISIASNASALPPGTYQENLTISATPFPPTYTTKDQPPPTTTQFITAIVTLNVSKSSASAVQLSASTFNFSAVASGALPSAQTFYLLNCRNATDNWTTTKTQSWLTLSPTSGSNLPSNGSFTPAGGSPNIQHTDYAVVTASINSTALSAGTYTDTITVHLGSDTATIAVSYVVTSTGSTMTLGASPTSASLSQVAGGTAVSTTTTLTNSGNTNGNYSTGVTYNQTQTGWLSVTPSHGTINGSGGTATITLTCTPGTLAAGTYTASVLFSPSIGSSTATVTVTFKVNAPSSITASPTTVSTSQTQGGANVSGTSSLSNSGASGNYTNTITYSSNGSGWLSLTNGSGTLGSTPVTVTFTCATGSLVADTYTATVKFTLGTSTATVTVTFVVNPVSAGSLTVSPATLTLTGIQNGSTVAATSTLSNSGSSGTYTSVTTYTSANGSGWLAVSPSTTAITTSQVVTFTCNPGSLAPDNYTAKVVFTLGGNTAQVNVTFTVSPSAPPTLAVSPPSLLFNDVVGDGIAAPQTITLTNTGSGNGTWVPTIAYAKGANWIVLSPPGDTLTAGASEPVSVTMNDISLAIGTYTATITFTAGASSVQVGVTLIINAITVDSSAQMTQSDMAAQYAYILSTVVGQQLDILASVFYSSATNAQVIYGELDALFPFETMSSLHVMKSTDDVTAFLNAYAYVAQVLSDAPIVYYRLGEASGIYAYDISGRNMTGVISTNNGAIVGVTQGQAGALTNSPDTAYLFDGTSGNILLPAGVNTANWGALSVEAWIKLSNITFSQTAFIVANDAPLTSNVGFALEVTKNSVIFRIGTGSTFYQINQGYTFAAGTWYHLVGVFAGTSLTAYVNGNQIANTTVTSAVVAQTTNVMNIASKPGTTANNFPGTLDEISVYNSALSAARVQVHYLGRLSGTSQTSYATLIVADNPVAFYRMNELSGLVAHDSSGNGFDATLSGSSLSYSVAGVLTTDTAIGFGGSDSLIFPSSLVLANYAGYSLEYWINITQGWQHIVITVDASGNTLYYLNGASYSSGSGDSVVVDIDVYYTGSFSAGSLDEIAVYPYVLSAAQVANHFNVGSLGV